MRNNKPLILLLLCFILLLAGCSSPATTQVDKSEQTAKVEKQEVKAEPKVAITPSFETTEYNTPFIEFEYPATWDDSDQVQKYGDKDTIKVIVGDINNATCITVKQIFDKNINSADKARTNFINICDSMQSIEYVDKTSFINGNIAILEGIVYGKSEIHAKEYFWNNSKGKTYQIEISTDNDNWDDIKEVIQVFEQSLKFKK